ncbi:MAG: TonB-dependent receptor [Candidatus Marinimicrobia bacterium]|nr:TonB-dependent receptor [Candidatus Neomarinimicrobiota bacterium]MCF7828586.1 TonB-dependent receptor [Candidatus Neomarinimicrobiota bacterium]MCF7880327.1 TonB-dependent receptor [Candidatus Neomarinimicrobiota bacterium]
MMKRISIIFAAVLGITVTGVQHTHAQQTGVIQGTVVDAKTQEPLIGVNVVVVDTDLGASTDMEGFYRITGVPIGTERLRFSYIGYETLLRTDVIVTRNKPAQENAELQPQAVEGEEVVVTAGYFEELRKAQTSKIQLSKEEIRRFPGGFEDVVRTVAALPGVAINNDGGRNDLLVRGGGPSENLYLINNIEIPNINHFGSQGTGSGSLSFINLDFVDKVDFSTGGFSAQYGDKMSSVLALDMADGREDRFGSKVLVSATQYGLNAEGPLGNDGNFIYSIRRSYLDLIFEANGLPFVPTYTDWNFVANYDVTPTDKLFVLGIGAYDEVNRDQSTLESRVFNAGIMDNSQNRWIGGLNYRHLLGSGYLDFTLSNNYTDFQFSQVDSVQTEYFRSEATEVETNLKLQHYWRLSNSVNLLSGASVKDVRNENTTTFADTIYNRNGDQVPVNSLGIPQRLEENSDAFKNALFSEIQWKITPKLEVSTGIRADIYTFLDQPWYVAPRFKMRYAFNEVFSLKSSAGIYYQAPSYVWVINDVNTQLKALRNNMAVVGFDYLLDEDLRLSVESYYKDYQDLPTGATPGTDYLVITNTGTGFGGRENDFQSFGYFPMESTAYGHAYGFELFLQKKYSEVPHYGKASLTYSKSEFTAGNGRVQPGEFDQRWIFNLYGGYKFNADWEMSGKFRFFTGAPYTPVYRPSENGGEIQNLPEEYLSKRLEPGHHLDVRLNRYWNFESWTFIAFIDIQNIYNNRIQVRPRYDFWEDEVVDRQGIGILPSIGLSAEL